MQKNFDRENDFRNAMLMWSDDYNANRLYGEGRWERLGKKATAISENWDLTEDWDELSPEDIVTFPTKH